MKNFKKNGVYVIKIKSSAEIEEFYFDKEHYSVDIYIQTISEKLRLSFFSNFFWFGYVRRDRSSHRHQGLLN